MQDYEGRQRIEILGGRGLKTPRPKFGCSTIEEEEVKKKKKEEEKEEEKKKKRRTLLLQS